MLSLPQFVVRILKLLLAALIGVLVVAAGAVVVTAVGAALVLFLLGRWIRRRWLGGPPMHARPRAPAPDDVIDVVATEVPVREIER